MISVGAETTADFAGDEHGERASRADRAGGAERLAGPTPQPQP